MGEAVFGFGLLFEGVTVMRSAMEPLLQSPLLRLELARVQQSPLHGLLAGVCMTLTVQSSSATVALLQSMAALCGAGAAVLAHRGRVCRDRPADR